MNKTISFLLILFISFSAKAQTETLSILKSNNALYFQTKDYQFQTKDYIDNNIIVNTNPISLPFIDDFSKNTLKPYNFNEVWVTDTILFATGTCVSTGEFTTQNIGFQTSQSYYYFYDTANASIDSIALAPIDVYNYSSSICFPIETSITTYWPSYYRSELTDFNTTTGNKLDSTLVPVDVVLKVATIYFANLPTSVNWTDNYAWWNTTNPINPLTIGVATLDGLNEYGLPYNKSVTNAYGAADFLTSKPIDLSLLGPANDVYLSFFYQAGGLGDFPNNEDSLVVEFKGLDGEWTHKWSTPGTTDTEFKQAYIPIYNTTFDSLIYSNTSFQFRFRNYASLSGHNDLWNIDYVRLDKDRSPNTLDTVIRDVAMLYDFPNYLETYSMLPWRQMEAGADSFTDTIRIPIRDNGQVEGLQAGNFPIDIVVENLANPDTIYIDTASNFNPILGEEIRYFEMLPNNDFTLPIISGKDSFYFKSEVVISPINRNSNQENDTTRNYLLFHNVMAYDDGSAERSYGLNGGGSELKRFAYEFNVATQDTLAAIQIHFSNTDENVDDLIFSLFAWDSLEIGVSELEPVHILGSIDNKKPNYIDEKNGFATFVFDTPIIVTGKFYVGWAQIDNRNLQIGYDLNSTKGRDKMFVFVGNNWQPSGLNLAGSPMMRVVLDGDFSIPNPTAIKNVAKVKYIKVYPNPTNTILNIEVPESIENYTISILDFSGKQVYSGDENRIDVSTFSKGIYMLSVVDNKTLGRYYSKFVVR